jgi:hypothetical protein
VDVDSGTDGGSVCNEANLAGAACGGTLSVIVGYTPDDFVDITPDDGIDNPVNIGHQPIYATYECAPAAEAGASECANVGAPTVCAFTAGDYCTYDRGNGNNTGYSGTTGTAGTIYNTNYLTAFPSGLTIGNVGFPVNDATWSGNATPGRANLKIYLHSPPGGNSGPLGVDTLNPTSTDGGLLSRRTATLALNIGFNDLFGVNGTKHNFGSLTLCNLIAGSTISNGDGTWTLTAAQAAGLNGKTISQVLADANAALGHPTVPNPVYGTGNGGYANLNILVDALNGSFASCTVSAFATSYLCPICP